MLTEVDYSHGQEVDLSMNQSKAHASHPLNIGIIGTILGFDGNNGKENGNYYSGVIYTLFVPFWVL